jgi:hypothetical protein
MADAQWDDLVAIWDDLDVLWSGACVPTILWDDPTALWDDLEVDWNGCDFRDGIPPVEPPAEVPVRPGGKDVYARTYYDQPDTLRERLLREDEEILVLV